jgi:hypothetical protein
MQHGRCGRFSRDENEPRLRAMKVKIFDVVLHNVPAGKSPATHLEDQINVFLKHYPNLEVVATHMNTLVVPVEPGSQAGPEATRPSVILFTTLFYK